MELIGWLGVFFFVISYLLLSLEILSAQKITYHWLNFLGAIGLVINAALIKDSPTIVVNGIWGLIAIVTVIKIHKRKN